MVNLVFVYKCLIIIKQYLLIFYGKFKTDNFLNYIEYFSWISGSVIALIGLLSIFLSVHYQNDLLEAKKIMRELNVGEKISHNLLIDSFKKYFFITTDDMKGYIESVSLFKNTSIALSILWIISGIGYLINLETYAGIIIVILSTILLCRLIISIIAKFENVYKKNFLLFPDFFNISKLSKKLNPKYDLALDIVIPTFTIELLYETGYISYSYKSDINIFNYGIVLSIRKTNAFGFYFNLGTRLPEKSNIVRIEPTIITKSVHSNSYINKQLSTLKLDKFESSIVLFLEDCSICYTASSTIDEDESKLTIKCYPVRRTNNQVPSPIKNFYKSFSNRFNEIFDLYPGIIKENKLQDEKITILKKIFINLINLKKKFFH